MFGSSHRNLRNEDVESVFEVLVGRKCRRMNGVIVGDCSVTTDNVVREVVSRVERGDVPDLLKGVKFLDPQFSSLVHSGQTEIEQRLGELRGSVSNCLAGGSAIIFAGDLRWAVVEGENNNSNSSNYGLRRNIGSYFSCIQYVTVELGRILRIRGEGRRVWLLATASYQTYMTLLQRQPSLESLLELQPVSVPRGGLDLSLQPCLTSEIEPKTSGVGVEALVPTQENQNRPMPFLKMLTSNEDAVEKLNCCYQCSANFEEEAKLLCRTEQSSLSINPNLPLWLQKCTNLNALSEPEAAAQDESKLRELRKRWNEECQRTHCNYHDPINLQGSTLEVLQHPASMVSSVNVHCPWWGATQSNAISGVSASRYKESSSMVTFPDWTDSSMSWQTTKKAVKDSTRADIVETTLTLGLSDTVVKGNDDEANKCTASSHVAPLSFSRALMNLGQLDPQNLKAFSERLTEKVPWQSEINMYAIASAVLQSRSCRVKGERRTMNKGDKWLMILGADRMGKKKMGEAIAEIIYGSQDKLLCIPSPWSSRGQIYQIPVKTYIDNLAQSISNDPHCVVLVDDMEQADVVFRTAILRAMESGKLVDSDGREVSLCDTIVLMTSSIGANNFINSSCQINEEKLSKLKLRCPGGLRLEVEENGEQVEDKLGQPTCKRKLELDLTQGEDRKRRKRKSPALDLNMDHGSDVTEETDALPDQIFRWARAHFSEYFFKRLDECIVFHPFDFSQLAETIQDKLHVSYCRATNGRGCFEVDEPVVERMVRFCWEMAPIGTDRFDKWVEEVFEVGLGQMLSMKTLTGKTNVRLCEAERNEGDYFYGNSLLPSTLEITGCSNCQFMADELTVCRMQRQHSNAKTLIQIHA